ncbi:MAG: type III PLP-dependent enzyme, partial [Alphaproteobacteria bacterium]
MTTPVFQPTPDVDIGFDVAVPSFASAEEAIAVCGDDRPLHCLYPQRLGAAVETFRRGFPGTVMYAVKCNPTPAVLALLARAGIRDFDVASIAEIDTVRRVVPGGRLYFMHPVKSRAAIRHACLAGIRDFALDSAGELRKIEEETGAHDLRLYVRIALPKGSAALDLSGKFGARGAEAIALLRRARARAAQLAVSFHVGSQCMEPLNYARGIAEVRALVDAAGIRIDALDVGGGFPVAYPGMEPPPPDAYFAAIARGLEENDFGDTPLLCEPGRALVASGGSVLARVELRKGDRLYLNDGTYGALFDAGAIAWRYPVRLVRARGASGAPLRPFSFFGPTCDSMDAMPGPFHLPDDVEEGDWIEIGQLGAYGFAMRSRFNGFWSEETVAIEPREADALEGVPQPRRLAT